MLAADLFAHSFMYAAFSYSLTHLGIHFCLFLFLRQGLPMWPRLVSNSLSSCLSLVSARITGMNYLPSIRH
jgi:hypothetical protein